MGNGDQFSKLLAERLKFAKEELSEAEKAEKSAHEKVVFLSEKVEAFSRALAAETGSPVLASRDSIAQMETPSQLSRARQLLEKIERGRSGKSDLVRELAISNKEVGITAKDVMDLFEKKGIPAHPNLGYSILSRLKALGDLAEARGRYYSTERLQASFPR